jgi:hypothetical protein
VIVCAAGKSQNDALAALGDENKIFQTTLRTLRRDTWIGRHRVLCFIIAPILFYPTAITLMGLPLGLFGQWLFKYSGLPRNGTIIHIWKWTTLSAFNLALPILGFLLIRAVCRRYYCGRGFAVTACGLTVAWSLATHTWITLPNALKGRVTFVMGAGLGWPLTVRWEWPLLCFYTALVLLWTARHARPLPRLATFAGAILVSAISLTGCASDTGRAYVAKNLSGPTLGRTALMIQRQDGAWMSAKPSRDKIHAAITQVLTRVSGTSVTDLPSPPRGSDPSDYELVMDGRQAHAKTVCFITIESIGSRLAIGIGLPPYWAGSVASYRIRVLDTASGKLLVDATRLDSTFHPLCEPPTHAVIDMQRGLSGLLPTVNK